MVRGLRTSGNETDTLIVAAIETQAGQTRVYFYGYVSQRRMAE
jgi:hypothetical protein